MLVALGSAMKNDLVLRAIDGPIARLTLNDPARANVLSDAMIVSPTARLTLNDPARSNVWSEAMMVALDGALAEAAADKRVRVIVLEAAGKVFCAGHDLAELRALDDPRQHESLSAKCAALMMAIGACRAPVIARVQGAAVAAGCQLVASCDLAYAAATAQFAVPGITLGLFCSTPGVALGRAVGRKASMDLLLTGRFIDASRAVALGLVNLAVPGEDLDAVIDDTARIIAANPPEAIALGKTTFRRQWVSEPRGEWWL